MKLLSLLIVLLMSSTDLVSSTVAGLNQEYTLGEELKSHGEQVHLPINYNGNDFSVSAFADEPIEISVSLLEDANPSNANGFQWVIEGPTDKNVKLQISVPKSQMRIGIRESVLIRNHKGTNNLVNPENIMIYETETNYVLEIKNVNEFSSWALFSSTPTMTEWSLIVLGSLLAVGGGFIAFRKLS